ncbi:unnamed protein product [Psylliodes chrysocephalus]|uniref:Uncharacterized protein n=1 Tax=Psylliodes chrysocephalus TaxID=3402493 RepID=A0A9P0D9C5_9CUCU|nr:unnamed protein product [Psylliodes chrysocephala]
MCSRKWETHHNTIMPNSEVKNHFGIKETNFEGDDATNDVEIAEEKSSSLTTWDTKAILHLIEFYKINEKLFKSSSVKRQKVWNIVSEGMKKEGYVYTKNIKNTQPPIENDEEPTEKRTKVEKKKESRTEKGQNKIMDFLQTREEKKDEERERRHREKIKEVKETRKAYTEVMQKLIEKL